MADLDTIRKLQEDIQAIKQTKAVLTNELQNLKTQHTQALDELAKLGFTGDLPTISAAVAKMQQDVSSQTVELINGVAACKSKLTQLGMTSPS
jgi:hypothetical protein